MEDEVVLLFLLKVAQRQWYQSGHLQGAWRATSKKGEHANVPVHYTNNSLRVTAATRMFTSGVPEKVVS